MLSSVHRWLIALLILVTTLALPAAPALPVEQTEPCGRVDLFYFPTHVPPGQLMEMWLTVENCSQMFESLAVDARPSGPCRFVYPEDAQYDLEPGLAVTQIVTFPAPRCPGVYRARVTVFFEGEGLDHDRARFIVEGGIPPVPEPSGRTGSY
jgi:hypothetical protein